MSCLNRMWNGAAIFGWVLLASYFVQGTAFAGGLTEAQITQYAQAAPGGNQVGLGLSLPESLPGTPRNTQLKQALVQVLVGRVPSVIANVIEVLRARAQDSFNKGGCEFAKDQYLETAEFIFTHLDGLRTEYGEQFDQLAPSVVQNHTAEDPVCAAAAHGYRKVRYQLALLNLRTDRQTQTITADGAQIQALQKLVEEKVKEIQIQIVAETTARTAAIAVENSARQKAIAAESAARTEAISKVDKRIEGVDAALQQERKERLADVAAIKVVTDAQSRQIQALIQKDMEIDKALTEIRNDLIFLAKTTVRVGISKPASTPRRRIESE